MPRPQSVKTLSKAITTNAAGRNFGRAIACNFGVTFSKTPCFPASNRQGSRKLRPAKAVAFSAIGEYEGLSQSEIDARCEYYKAVATADKVNRVKQIDIDLAQRKATLEYYARWAVLTATGQDRQGADLPSNGSYCVQNLLSPGLGRVGEWRFDDYTQKDGLWVMHAYYLRVHDYFEPITYKSGNFYFGGYSNMHGCSDETCGDASHYQILYDFYVPSTTAAYNAFRATLNSESALAKEQRTADIATAFAAYNSKYCDLYYDSEEATWDFGGRYLTLDITSAATLENLLWDKTTKTDRDIIAALQADNSIDILIDSTKASAANKVAHNAAISHALGQFQIDWRTNSEMLYSTNPTGSAARSLDLTWAANTAAVREAYTSGLGAALVDSTNTFLSALKSYDATAFSTAIDRFWGRFANEQAYATEVRTLAETYACGAFDAEKTKSLAFTKNDITNRKNKADYEAELACNLVTTLSTLVGPDFNAFTTKQNSLRYENSQKLTVKKSELNTTETAANKAAEAALFQAMRLANTAYRNGCIVADMNYQKQEKTIDLAYRTAREDAKEAFVNAAVCSQANYGEARSLLNAQYQAALTLIGDGKVVPEKFFTAKEKPVPLPPTPGTPPKDISQEELIAEDVVNKTTTLADKIAGKYADRTVLGKGTLDKLYEKNDEYEFFKDDGHVAKDTYKVRYEFLYQYAKMAEANANSKIEDEAKKIDIEDGQCWKIKIDEWTGVFSVLPKNDETLQIQPSPDIPKWMFVKQASFWLGGGKDLEAYGTFWIRFFSDSDNPAVMNIDIHKSICWRWDDCIDAHSFQEYNWEKDGWIQGVAEGLCDLVGDKALNGYFYIYVCFGDDHILELKRSSGGLVSVREKKK